MTVMTAVSFGFGFEVLVCMFPASLAARVEALVVFLEGAFAVVALHHLFNVVREQHPAPCGDDSGEQQLQQDDEDASLVLGDGSPQPCEDRDDATDDGHDDCPVSCA
jgi:hypothetical protein